LADKKACEPACSISRGNTDATDEITVSNVYYKLVTEIVTSSW